jgi:hypothetical protein
VPKSGTHLVLGIVRRLPGLVGSGRHFNWTDYNPAGPEPCAGVVPDVDLDAFLRDLRRVKSGQYAGGHLQWRPGCGELLTGEGFATVFVYRDPRDVLVSDLHYIMSNRLHFLHRQLTERYPDDDARLMGLIEGFEADRDLGRGLVDVGQRLDGFAGWLGTDAALGVRFEDLVGVQGGGTQDAQREALTAICAHLQRDLTAAQLDALASQLWSTGSVTFNSGRLGRWREQFTADHEQAFAKLAGNQLRLYGYE